jgi:DNA-binding FadR family transcriptional regulator
MAVAENGRAGNQRGTRMRARNIEDAGGGGAAAAPADDTPADGTLADVVFDQLAERIRVGTYASGDRLPSETRLAVEFGVSRPVVRAALARLRRARMIVSRRGSGSFVADADGVAAGGGYGPLESVADIAAWYDFRKLIESEIAALAAAAATDEQLEAIGRAAAELEETLDSGGSGVELDIVLHATIAAAAGNRFLCQTLRMLRPHLHFVASFARRLGRTGYLTGRTQARDEHREIVKALAARDAMAARAAMRAHIEGSQRRVFTGE